VRSVAAENVALRKQLIALSRNKKRAPKLTTIDRVIFGVLAALVGSKRLSRVAIVIKPTTLIKFHNALVQRKYHLLFSTKEKKKPGPKGLSPAIVDAIAEMKKRNPRYGTRGGNTSAHL